MKLKTLNDIDFYPRPIMQFEGDIKEQLKKEAIKWVKRLNVIAIDQTQVIDWITYFFNIIEEDLK